MSSPIAGRLEHLYYISKLFAGFEDVQQTLEPALAIIGEALPLRGAILIEAEGSATRLSAWASADQDAAELAAVRRHALAAYAYLTGAGSPEALEAGVQAATRALPRQEVIEGELSRRLIVIPLVVARRPSFGALQLEAARPLDKTDLMFANAIANQLAIALDRDLGRRRDVARREEAELRRAEAERDKAVAEQMKQQYEALAAENARLYQQEQHAVRVREQVLAVVSHDLKNPLQTIILAGSALERATPATLPQTAEKIQRAAQRMVRLIEDLLDFASIQAGRLAIDRSLHEVGGMIAEALSSFEGIAAGKRLQLLAQVEPGLPQLHCDRDRILQVFANLVGNATKIVAEGGHVTLRAHSRGHELLFKVEDDGPGIRAEDAAHIFERYWRGGEAGYQGTGLGLAIAKGIVNAHGGLIWVESEPGRGASFFFTIPTDDRRHTTRRSGEPATP